MNNKTQKRKRISLEQKEARKRNFKDNIDLAISCAGSKEQLTKVLNLKQFRLDSWLAFPLSGCESIQSNGVEALATYLGVEAEDLFSKKIDPSDYVLAKTEKSEQLDLFSSVKELTQELAKEDDPEKTQEVSQKDPEEVHILNVAEYVKHLIQKHGKGTFHYWYGVISHLLSQTGSHEVLHRIIKLLEPVPNHDCNGQLPEVKE